MRLRTIAGLVGIVFLALVTPARAQLTTTVSAAAVASQLEKTFAGTAVHLHNLGPISGGRTYVANASSIKVPARVTGTPGQRTYFALPDESILVLGRRYGYYLNHVRSNGLFVTANPDSFTFSITLASPTPALVGTCTRQTAPAAPCAAIAGLQLPPIEWRDARIDVVMKPIAQGGSLTLEVQSVAIGGSFDLGAVCQWPLVGARLCAALTRQSDKLRARVADQVKASLNTAHVRRTIAAGVRQYLDTTLGEPLLGIRRVSMQNGVVTIGLGLGR